MNHVCTLRAAVQAADHSGSAGATIILPALLPGALYILHFGALNATQDMTIIDLPLVVR